MASSGVAASWMKSTSSAPMVPSRYMVSAANLRRSAQNCPPMEMTGKRSSLPVWTSVITSKASSSVPKPPGITTKAQEYFTSITLRTKKCSSSMNRSR